MHWEQDRQHREYELNFESTKLRCKKQLLKLYEQCKRSNTNTIKRIAYESWKHFRHQKHTNNMHHKSMRSRAHSIKCEIDQAFFVFSKISTITRIFSTITQISINYHSTITNYHQLSLTFSTITRKMKKKKSVK